MDISAVVKSLVLESVKDPEIRKAIGEISKDYIQDANTDAVHDWCDSNAPNAIRNHIEENKNIDEIVEEVIKDGTFDISFG